MAQLVFNRTETKYVLTPAQYQALMSIIEPYLQKDRYFKGTNCSIYYDTPSRYLAIHSVESPVYKEKIRLRSYGVPALDDTVFLEIKKKFRGVGSKRRIPIKLSDFYQHVASPTAPSVADPAAKPSSVAADPIAAQSTAKPSSAKSHAATADFAADPAAFASRQIQAEVDHLFQHYHLEPTLFLAYDRLSYCDEDNPAFRITFDANIRSRTDDLRLELGDHGQPYFQNGEIVMETKASNSYPFWFVQALNRLKIYPAKFSKYGRVMAQEFAKPKSPTPPAPPAKPKSPTPPAKPKSPAPPAKPKSPKRPST